ncbi:MAG: LysR family transcriptional regulator [Actinomycetota bacterium]
MTFGQLRTFLELARQRSVRGAAAALQVTEPSVSAAVSALSRELDVELVERDGRGIRLTSAGEELTRYAAQILGLTDQAVRRVREVAGKAARLHLAAVTTAGEYLLPPVLKVFRERRPEVQLWMEVGNRASVLQRLTSREADLGIGGRPPEGRGISGEPFLENLLVVVASRDHPFASKRSVEPARLAQETWLLREGGSGTRQTTEEFFAQVGIGSPPMMTLGSNGAVKRGAAAGLGVTLISAHAVAAELAAGGLVRLEVRGTPLRRSWWVLNLERDGLSRHAIEFLELLRSPAARKAIDEWFGAGVRASASIAPDSTALP